jgi:pyruvate ferredoxin oxidoreductase alpha subunit
VPTDVIHGSKAVAEAVKLCDVDVIAAYPITPQTRIVENLAKFVARGDITSEYIKVESEHSALSACIGASATGARTFTATSSQGLTYMFELLFVASGMRMPIVMANANRALSAPLNIWNDQQDSVSARDSGWIQLYAETNQEALDSIIQAYKISEDHGILIPSMVCLDGYVLTHTIEPVDIPEKALVEEYLPPFKPAIALDLDNPITLGAFAHPGTYMEFRYRQQKALERALKVIEAAGKEYGKLTGRQFGLVEKYNMEEADVVIVTMGSLSGTVKDTLNSLGNDRVGLLRVRAFRPFPMEEIKNALRDVQRVMVIEKDISIGLGEGALHSEIKGALYDLGNPPPVAGFIAGLGGRDVTPEDIKGLIKKVEDGFDGAAWVGLK